MLSRKQLKVIWVGPIVGPSHLSKYKAVSPAANKWQMNFITSLMKQGIQVINVSYLPEQIFPKGRLFPYYKQHNDSIFSIQSKYINLPKLKNVTLGANIFKEISKHNDSEVVITYNNYIPHTKAASLAKKKYNMKWVNIVADDNFVEGPDLTLFLSYGYFLKSEISPKMHIDGGLYPLTKDDYKPKRSVILFSGALNKWTGIEEFAEQFLKLDQRQFELHIYGKGDSILLRKLSASDRIKLKGFVSDEELEKSMQECFAFVNPRPIDIPGGENNFPSKLLEYLRYGKPVISTKTAGIAPYYDNVLYYYDPLDTSSLVSTINKLSNLDDNDMKLHRHNIEKLYSNHNWNSISDSFLKKIKSLWFKE
ncbi:MAG TPA: glycosyltransferase [Gallicola sp.]|nr:glycosyltransferase [Gallicola sp.]